MKMLIERQPGTYEPHQIDDWKNALERLGDYFLENKPERSGAVDQDRLALMPFFSYGSDPKERWHHPETVLRDLERRKQQLAGMLEDMDCEDNYLTCKYLLPETVAGFLDIAPGVNHVYPEYLGWSLDFSGLSQVLKKVAKPAAKYVRKYLPSEHIKRTIRDIGQAGLSMAIPGWSTYAQYAAKALDLPGAKKALPDWLRGGASWLLPPIRKPEAKPAISKPWWMF